ERRVLTHRQVPAYAAPGMFVLSALVDEVAHKRVRSKTLFSTGAEKDEDGHEDEADARAALDEKHCAHNAEDRGNKAADARRLRRRTPISDSPGGKRSQDPPTDEGKRRQQIKAADDGVGLEKKEAEFRREWQGAAGKHPKPDQHGVDQRTGKRDPDLDGRFVAEQVADPSYAAERQQFYLDYVQPGPSGGIDMPQLVQEDDAKQDERFLEQSAEPKQRH